MQNDRFAKTADCPDNEILLAYERAELSGAQAESVRQHLCECEFCLLMLDLLAFHPQGNPGLPDVPPLPEKLSRMLPLLPRRPAKN